MIHVCSICGKEKECDGEIKKCDRPKKIPMNCMENGKPIHQDLYINAIGEKVKKKK